MRKLLTNKFVIIVVMLVVFLFFGSITNTLTLNNRAIVVGMALDYEEGEIKVSCQTLVAGSAGADKVSNNTYAVTTSRGKTLGEAVQKIIVDSAEYVSFAHCNSIIIGKEMASSGRLYETLEELLLNSKIMENTTLVYVDGSAKEMITEKIAINLMTSFAIQRMVSSNKDYYDVVECTIKDYLSITLNEGSVVVMPEVKLGIEVEESSQESQSDSDKKVILSIRSGACLTKNNVVGLLSEEEVVIYNLVKKEFSDGMMTIDVNGKEIGMEFENKKSEINCIFDSDKPKADCKIEMTLADMNYVNDYQRDETVVQTVEKEYSQKVKENVEALYYRFAEKNFDLFDLHKSLYASYGSKYLSFYPKFNGSIPFTAEVTVKVGE